MNRVFKRAISIVAALALAVSLIPAMSADTAEAAAFKIKNVTNNKRTMYVGAVYQIKTNASSVTYTSTKKSVATVDDSGLVTALKKGKTTIKVKNTATGKTIKLKIKVKKQKGFKVKVKSGTYNKTKKVTIKAKKGYTVYYTTGKKFKKKKKIASKKKKTITVSKDTTLMIYVKKNKSKISVKKMNKTKKKSAKCVTFKYIINSSGTDSGSSSGSSSSSSPTSTYTDVEVPTASVPDVSDVNTTEWDESDTNASDTEDSWSSIDNICYVTFTDSSISVLDADGNDISDDTEVTLKKTVLKICNPDYTYVLSGTLEDGSIQVKSTEGEYTVILNGVTVTSSSTAAFYATKKATKLIVTLAEGSENSFYGPSEYTFDDGEDEPDSTFFVKKALTINGSGSLYVESTAAENGDALKCKDILKIAGGDITVVSAEDGITANDSFSMCDGTVTVTADKDGIRTNQDEDLTLGYVDVTGGTISVTAGGDGIQADTTASFSDTDITMNYSASSDSTVDSFKGIKAGGTITETDEDTGESTSTLAGLIYIQSGTYTFNTREDAIHGKKDVVITGGTFDIVSYSDGIEADYNLTISDVTMSIVTKKNSSYTATSFKGLKAGISSDDSDDGEADGTLYIISGDIDIDTTAVGTTNSSGTTKGDDGVHSNNMMQIDGGTITVAAGDDAFHSDNELVINDGTIDITTSYEGIESYIIYLEGGTVNINSNDDGINAAGGNDSSGDTDMNTNPWGSTTSTESSDGTLYIHGGTYTVRAEGDGLDSNGDIYMTGGSMYVYGPTSGGNGIFDYGDNDNVFEKSGGLLIGAGTSDEAVYPTCTSSAVVSFTVSGTANKSCSFNDGTSTYTFTPTCSYQLVIISTPDMTNSTSYTLTYNGSSTATSTSFQYSSGNSNGNSVPNQNSGMSGNSMGGSSTGGR